MYNSQISCVMTVMSMHNCSLCQRKSFDEVEFLLIQDRIQWRTLVDAVMSFWFYKWQ